MTQPDTHSSNETARALWYVDRGLVAVLEENLPLVSGSDHVRVKTVFSAISRGTERLVYLGAVPESEWHRMRAPMQMGAFPFPVKYGYCAVGVVDGGVEELMGRTVFCLHPHQDVFVVPKTAVTPVPAGVPARRATLAANMETAVNALWDGRIAIGDRVNVIGAGILGLLTAYLCTRVPGTDVTLIDVDDSRRNVAQSLGLRFARPRDLPVEADLVFHTSASAQGLQSAIDCAAMEARIVEMSWYGAREIGIGLGGAFHSKRLSLILTQVGHVSAGQRPRWTFERRLAKAIELLADPLLDALMPTEIGFKDVAECLPRVFADNASGLPPVIKYGRD